MSNTQSKGGWAIAAIIIVFLLIAWSDASTKVGDLEATNADLQTQLESAQSSLNSANAAIDEVNASINRAQDCSFGCTYDELVDAIDSLKTIQTEF